MQTISEAWSEFGTGNGVSSQEVFKMRAKEVLNLSSENIRSIVLEKPVWLDIEDFIHVNKQTFPSNILASKYFTESELPNQIKLLTKESKQLNIVSEPEEIYQSKTYNEGKILLAKHIKRERNQALIDFVKRNRKRVCEICGLNFKLGYGVDYIEAHHKEPLAALKEGETRESTPEDITLLCANCHKAVHCYMRIFPALSYEGITGKIQSSMKK